jgi:hypothetical protein
MSLRIRTVISGVHKYLDLFDDEDILMSFSVGEIQDITSKNSSYSKAFTLPGTKNNNEIFNYFYDINSTPLDFDPNDKFDAIISEHDTCFSVCRISKKNVFEKRYYCFDLSKAKMQTEAKLERVKNNGEKTFLLKKRCQKQA